MLPIIIPPQFEWNPAKEFINIGKHGVSFHKAKQAFDDENRIIAENDVKDRNEERYYCYGIIDGKVMTVRFTLHGNFVRIIGAAYWRKGRKIYESRYKH